MIADRATIDDLYRVDGKAELINGEIMTFMSTGGLPGYAAGEIFFFLRLFIRQNALPGYAITDNNAFLVNLPNRQSFSPDAGYYIGQPPTMRFYNGAPVFAVEVRSENDYGVRAERDMADKRTDYFAAGTEVVWDVDLQGPDVVKKYTIGQPNIPTVYRRGDTADALPALPDWSMLVNDLFP